MEVRGNIGEGVWIKATINKILIDETKTEYGVRIQANDVTLFLNEDDIKFEKANEQLKETVTADTDFPQEVKRGPGRPRKATVESLMKKCEEIKRNGE